VKFVFRLLATIALASASSRGTKQRHRWDLLDRMRQIGFVDVDMLLYWSAENGYYGVEQTMIFGRKARYRFWPK
jgi:hypothetical protein